MNFMQPKNTGISNDDLYKLMDSLSIEDSCALIAGVSPNKVIYEYYDNEETAVIRTSSNDPDNANEVFFIALKALTHAIKTEKLKAFIEVKDYPKNLVKSDLNKNWLFISEIDTCKTMIERDDLKEWLDKRGVYPPLLFPMGKKDDYMNVDHPNYSPKLALCVRAWEVAQTANLQGQTIKQFIVDWMQEHAKEFGVSNTGDKIFDTLATIPNWNTTGGRAKNKPTPPNATEGGRKEKDKVVSEKLLINLPEDIPKNEGDIDLPF